MSNVVIDKQKIDILANAIADKSGESVTMTLDEMVSAVDSIDTSGGEPNLQAKTYTVDSAGTETITADAGYDGLSEVEVSVPSATAGTPTATKGSVSNHSVSVTPSVTNTTGYITGSTINGTAVTVSASELVSGSETKTANGTYNVTNLAEIVVDVQGGGAAITVTDTTDTHGGIIREITAVNISDTTAVASDVASGKYFYTSAGVKTEGTASGGGGLEYEEGTWTPTEDIARPTISFANIHTARPVSIIFADINNAPLEGYNHAWIFSSFIDSVGAGVKVNVSGNTHYYARVTGWYLSTGATSASVANYNITNTTDSSGTGGMGYWATTAGFIPGSGSTSRYWKSGRTYKWIAVWAPTT